MTDTALTDPAATDQVPELVVAVVEDHPLYRAALTRLLAGSPGVTVAADVESVPRLMAERLGPEAIVLLDLNLPGVQGAAAVTQVVGAGHKVLVVSAHAEQDVVLAAIGAGARGYLTKDSEGAEVLRALREVAAGRSYVSPTLASFLLNASRSRGPGAPAALSDREREVLALLAAGERDQDIAEALHISVRTVRSHLDRIRDKTGRRRRSELTRLAIEQGIEPPTD